MRKVDAATWVPVEIDSLEPDADEAVRARVSGIVVAGPGAGKTELLAQRACFLFQTGICPIPKRILAISFKRDAASNLRRRVRQRCGVETARRFDSMTFDSFGKGLLDRFLLGLPESFRPTWDYQIDFEVDRAAGMRKVLNQVSNRFSELAGSLIRSGAEEDFFKRHVIGRRLVANPTSTETPDQALAREVWRVLLFGGKSSRLTFTMIGRLAELMLRTNPAVLKALRATYAFAFLDEFQDTTRIQYDLTVTAFQGSTSVMTAVGDPKQRIMLWAGALNGVFKQFQTDFGARHHSLAMNYRSAPKLVQIQQHLISALEPNATKPKAFRKKEDGAGECRVFIYPDHKSEAEHLATYLAEIVQKEGVEPSEICVLTRTWNEKYSTLLIEALKRRSIQARSEKDLQDLLAEPVVNLLMLFLRFTVMARIPKSWNDLTEACFELWGVDDGTGQAVKVERKLIKARLILRKILKIADGSKESVAQVLEAITKLFGEQAIRQLHPQYRQGTYYADVLEQLASHLSERLRQPMTWEAALDDLEGRNCIPIMTVHKSKGLEYDTVVFVGLEDSSFWNFQNSPEEEKCGFFVAFSRAIKRVVFTFSDVRPRNIGGYPEQQSRKKIGILYDLLAGAGVQPEKISLEV